MSEPAVIHRSGWPWPLDSVQGWFESLWDGVYGWISDSAAVITNFVTEAVSVVQDWIGVVAGWINTAVSSISDFVVSTVAGVATWISDSAAATVAFLTEAINATGAWITEGASWVAETVGAGLAGIVDSLSAAAAAIGEATAGFGTWIAEGVQGGLEWLSSSIWTWFDGALSWASDTFAWLHGEVMGAVAGVTGTVQTMFDGASTVIGDALTGAFGMLAHLGDVFNPMQYLTDLQNAMSGFVSFISDVLTPHSPRSPDEAFGLAQKHLAAVDAAWWSISLSNIAVELATAGQVDITTNANLFTPTNRAAWDSAAKIWGISVEKALLVPYEQYMNRAFTPILPGVQDLIKFVVREVITPERFTEVMPFWGYAPEWAKAYWESHWILPAPAVLYDAFHRGIISAEELNKFIVLHDFKPEPRPGMSKSDVDIMRGTLKTLIPRVDLRYAWELGTLSDAELEARYVLLGYEDDAPLMADIQKARALVEEVHKVRDEWIRYFIGGFIDEGTLRANLAAVGIGPARIEFYVVYAEKRREREALADWLDIYEDAYFKDLLSDEDLTSRVNEILVDKDAVDLFLEKAYIRKYKKPKVAG